MRRYDVLPDDLYLLWDPYVKGSGSRTGGGSGLGLFVVRTILDKYGLKEFCHIMMALFRWR